MMVMSNPLSVANHKLLLFSISLQIIAYKHYCEIEREERRKKKRLKRERKLRG